MKKLFVCLLMIVLWSGLHAKSLSDREWKEDIDFLKRELPKHHKNLFFAVDKNTFNKQLDLLSHKTSNLSDRDIVLSIQQIIAAMGDDHTGIAFGDIIGNDGRLPLSLYWFSDGIHILATTNKHEAILGCKLVAINDVPIESVIERFATLQGKTNDAIIKHRVPNMIPSIGLLQFFKTINNDSAKLTLTDEAGKVNNVMVHKEDSNSQMDWINATPEEKPLFLKNRKELFWAQWLDKEKVLYVQYNRCWSRELEMQFRPGARSDNLPSFEEFTDEIINILDNADVEKFVFDVRNNPGGSSPQGTEFVYRIKEYDSINRKGHLFVIIGKRTFSSAILNTLNFMQNTQAILVGEETSGKPNHFGEVKRFTLPNSKLNVNYSSKYFKYLPDDPPSIVPDIPVSTTFADYKAGKDPIMDAILNYKPE